VPDRRRDLEKGLRCGSASHHGNVSRVKPRWTLLERVGRLRKGGEPLRAYNGRERELDGSRLTPASKNREKEHLPPASNWRGEESAGKRSSWDGSKEYTRPISVQGPYPAEKKSEGEDDGNGGKR